MGGRGSSSGISHDGKKYGTEFRTIHQHGNIKFVQYNGSKAARSPMETMTKGRVYVTLANTKNGLAPKFITYYDKKNKRFKQIDLAGRKHMIDGEMVLPHTHKGYFHSEKGTDKPSPREEKMIERVLRVWYNINR